jgi:hypothetical protein
MSFITQADFKRGRSDPIGFNRQRMLDVLAGRLKDDYNDVVAAPLPERLAALARRLQERREPGRS